MLLLLLTGCGVTRVAPVSEVRIIERTELQPYTVFVEIPQIDQRVETLDTSSHLENEYALSDAVIDRKGKLTHTLSTKPQKRPEIVEIPVVFKDSIVTVEKVVEKEIPAELTASQKFKIWAFWPLLVLSLLTVGRIAVKLIKTKL